MNKKEPTLRLIIKTIQSKNKLIGGFSLIEILISILILALIMTGLVSLFISGKRWILHTRSRMAAGELGKYFLEPLQMEVRQDTWDQPPYDPAPNNLLTAGNYKSTNNSFPGYETYTVVSWFEEPNVGGITYYPVYRVENKDGVRKVRFTLIWNEPVP